MLKVISMRTNKIYYYIYKIHKSKVCFIKHAQINEVYTRGIEYDHEMSEFL